MKKKFIFRRRTPMTLTEMSWNMLAIKRSKGRGNQVKRAMSILCSGWSEKQAMMISGLSARRLKQAKKKFIHKAIMPSESSFLGCSRGSDGLYPLRSRYYIHAPRRTGKSYVAARLLADIQKRNDQIISTMGVPSHILSDDCPPMTTAQQIELTQAGVINYENNTTSV